MAEHTGGMIALIPRAEDTDALTVPGGEKAADLHLTLAYLGDDVADMPNEMRNIIVSQAAAMAAGLPPVEARVFGHGVFNPDGFEGREPCSVYLVGQSPAIDMIRQSIMEQVPPDIRALQLVPFIPHITARYGALKKLSFTGDLVFDRVSVALAGDTYDFPLGEPVDEKSLDSFKVEIKRAHARETLQDISVKSLRQAIARYGTLDVAARRDARPALIRAAQELGVTSLLPDGWLQGKAADAEIGDLIQAKVMSPSPNATRLREYWAHGEGRRKWRPGTPGDFNRLRRQLAKYVQNPAILDGLTANIHKLATGEWPGRNAHGGKKDAMAIITAEELKAAALLADPDADIDFDSLGLDESEEDGGDEDGDNVDAVYEQSLVDEVEWDIDAHGEPVQVDDEDGADEHDQAPSAQLGPRPAMVSLFD